MDIDWSKAPEGATHFDTAEYRIKSFMKLEDGAWYFWPPMSSEPSWGYWGADGVDSDTGPFVARPTDSKWNGEGLPPVGTVCELRAHKLNEWGRAVIKFASRNVVVWDWEGEPEISGLCTRYAHEVEMRQIRTPEQIAAEERDQAIKEMIAGNDHEFLQDWAAYVYDILGYRKQVKP